MRCPACGKQLPEDPFYCAYCGAVVRPPPAPLPGADFGARAAGLALVGAAAALPLSVGFWLLAGQLAQLSWSQGLALGVLVAVLTGVVGAGLHDQIGWPLAAQPPRCSPRQLALTYGFGGAGTAALGAVLAGIVVLPLAWGLAIPDLPSLLAGGTLGLVAIAFAVPPAALVGVLAGYGLGQVAERRPGWATWAAALTWWLAGSAGGGVAGAFVASRGSLALAPGVFLGATVQAGLQAFLLPLATYLVRWYLVLTGS